LGAVTGSHVMSALVPVSPGWLLVAAVLAAASALVPPPVATRRPWREGTRGSPLRALDRWRSQSRRVDVALPALLDELVRSLQSGATLTSALAEASAAGGPLGDDLKTLTGDLRAGAPVGTALERWRERRPGTRVGLVVAAVDLATMAGGELAGLLGSLAEALRDEEAVAEEAQALATQARASAAVVALAPLAFAVIMTPFRSTGFVGSGSGLVIVAVGLALDAVGLWWMWRLTAVNR